MTARMIFSVMMAVMMRITNMPCIMTMAIRIMMKIRMMTTLAPMRVTMAMRIVMTIVRYVGNDI